jgi:xanthine dehydrogenase molybdenum-binding subunit
MVYLKGFPEREDYRVPVGVLLRRAHYRGGPGAEMIMTRAFYEPDTEMMDARTAKGNISETYVFAAHGVEVEVDPGTGRIEILRFVAAHDVGRALNPLLLEGQIYGGVMQGVGYALHEEMILEKGRILNPDLLDYKIPTMLDGDFPLEVVIIETHDAHGPFGAKGIGEIGIIPVAPAIANAVAAATGTRLRQLPLNCEKVLAGLLRRSA